MEEECFERTSNRCGWLCCLPCRRQNQSMSTFFYQTNSNFVEEPSEYVVEKLKVNKVPVRFLQNKQNLSKVPIYPFKTPSNYSIPSEEILNAYDLDHESNDSVKVLYYNNNNKNQDFELSSSRSTVTNSSVDEYKKENNPVVKSTLQKQKGKIETGIESNDNFDKKYDKTINNRLKIVTFDCLNFSDKSENVCSSNDQNFEIIHSSSPVVISNNSKCDVNTQTSTKEFVAISSKQCKLGQFKIKRSIFANESDESEPVQINLTLRRKKSKVEKFEKGIQTDFKFCDIMTMMREEGSPREGYQENHSLINRKMSNRIQYLENVLAEKDNNINQIRKMISPWNFLDSQDNLKLMDYYQKKRLRDFQRSEFLRTTRIEKDVNNILPLKTEFDRNNFKTAANNSYSQRSSDLFDLCHNDYLVLENHPIKDISKNEKNVNFDSYSEFQYSECSQSMDLHSFQIENKMAINNKIPSFGSTLLPSGLVQEIRNVDIINKSPFKPNKKVIKNRSFYDKGPSKNVSIITSENPERFSSLPKLEEAGREAEIISADNNPVKWKIIIKQRKSNTANEQ